MKVWYALALVAAVAACKSPPKGEGSSPSIPATNAAAPKSAMLDLDPELLVREVEALRDREFAQPPQIRGVTPYTEMARCTDACRNERVLLSDVLFGTDLPQTPRLAHFDRTENAVLYDASATDAAAVEFAIVAALVEGLDRQTGAPLPQPSAWDELLAREAVARGPGVFVAALRAARAVAPDADAAALAAHPEALLEVAPGGVVADFAQREGFALTAALYRSGGWSAVELLRNEPPASTAGVVRPDRYLDGADYGDWTFPAAVDAARDADGWTAAETGRVGPAVFVEWLARHVDPRVARAAYLGLESDAYRTWRRGDDAWSWEWVTLWNTPATAQQVLEVLDAALRTAKGRRYSVVRRGATIAVVGDSKSAQWVPAFQLLAKTHDWQIKTYTMSACSFSAKKIPLNSEPYENCHTWGKDVIDRLTGEEKPDVVFASTTPGEVFSLIEQARERRGWRILIFHRFTTGTPDNRFPPQYSLRDYEAVLDEVVASGLDVVTTEQGLARLACTASETP